MEIAKSQFSKQTELDLIRFLKLAKDCKSNGFCHLEKYRHWKKILPLDPELKSKLKEYETDDTVIVLEESDDEELSIVKQETIKVESGLKGICLVDDCFLSIKDHLESSKSLPPNIVDELATTDPKVIKKVFNNLVEDLSPEDVYNCGMSILAHTSGNPHLMQYFCRYLLIRRIMVEHKEILQQLLLDYSKKFPHVLIEELTLAFKEEHLKLLYQYIAEFKDNFKVLLLRGLLPSLKDLRKTDVATIEILVNKQAKCDDLKLLINILSYNAESFATDKNFGKLVLNVINLLDADVGQVEQAVKHIIGFHKSVWKSKIQKAFDAYFEDSVLLTQSFM